ncbi:PH domain-containing protein [Streptomyces sp. NPDC058417]|uniref:PH domain-containing protein n=1 Tax=unclassified Streptomyces TaxID=2593676 RepID=UPI00365B0EF5
MTTPHEQPSAPRPTAPETQDRIYRSPMGMVGGVLLLALVGWLGIDAIVAGEGRTPWLALALLILLVPLITAFTLRPAVFSGEDRLRVRNPFRIVALPWGQVASLRSAYSNEAVTEEGKKIQLWAVPVSLRARKRAARQQDRAAAEKAAGRDGRRRRGLGGFGGGPAGFGGGLSSHGGTGLAEGPARADTDKVMDELRDTWERRHEEAAAQGEVTVRWAWEIVGPAAAGAVVLLILLAVG